MSPYRHGPRPLSIAIDNSQDRWEPATALAAIQAAWPEAVGPVMAAESTPVREAGGVVTVECAASVWAQEIELLGPSILPRLN
jgi:predicted nucleic acid-binding Zn ribbon protein